MNPQTVFITGGASGLGLETARALAAQGDHIVIFNRGAQAARQALEHIEAARRHPSQTIASYLVDVADRTQVLEGFARATKEVGAPGTVIHMAGIGAVGALNETDFEAFEKVVQINLYGTRHVVEAALACLRSASERRGKIVLAGSLGGHIPVYGYTAYGSSKFAVVGLAACLRYELKPLGIDVHSFCPGEVMTPALAAERAATPPATRALKYIGGTMACDAAVRGLLAGIRENQFLIIPGWRSKLVYWAYRLTPLPLWNFFTDAIIAHALRASQH